MMCRIKTRGELRAVLYPPEVIEEIRTGNDIADVVSSYVPLKPRGSGFVGLCPFHNEKTASFSVSPDKQIYYCFGCGASGNVIGFIMQIENHEFLDAIKLLADRIHYRLPEHGFSREAVQAAAVRERLFEMNKLAARFFYDTLHSNGELANQYLDSRNLGERIRRKYGLGYSEKKWDALCKHLLNAGYDDHMLRSSGLAVPDKKGGLRDKFVGRLMFPIFNAGGKVVGFGGRTLLEDGVPKYLNSPDTPVFDKSKNLYGINFARASRSRSLIVVEGYMDVLALAQAGFMNVVASLGTAFNKDHVNVLKKYADSVTLLFDSDDAGNAAALRAIQHLVEGGVRTKVLQAKDSKDPDEYINRFGAEAFGELLGTAVDQAAFRIRCIQKRHDLSQTDGRVQFVKETAKLLAELESAVEREVYARDTAKTTGISYDAIVAEIERVAGKPLAPEPIPLRKRPMRGDDRAMREAQKELLLIAAGDSRVCSALIAEIASEELLEPVYARLLDIIFETHKSGRTWYPAEALSNFTDPDEQRRVAEVFVHERNMEDDDVVDSKRLAISVSDSIKKIRLYNIDRKLESNENAHEVQELMAQKQKVRNFSLNLDK